MRLVSQSKRNEVFRHHANIATDILILPAFAYYGLLPEDSGGKTIIFENGERKKVD